MRVLIVVSLLLLAGFVFAQDEEGREEFTATVTLEEQVMPAFGRVTAQYVDIETELAQEIFYGPTVVESEMREGYQTTPLYITLASRVNTKVNIDLSDPDLLITYENLDGYILYRGIQQTVNFVAFAPHSGTITILNEVGEVLAVVPYTVRKEDQFRHTINGGVNTSGSASASYSLSSNQGWGISTGVSLDIEGEFSGSINGSYSW